MNSLKQNAMASRLTETSDRAMRFGKNLKDAVICVCSNYWRGGKQIDARQKLNRKEAGILYADIAGYARLTELDEEGTHYRLTRCMEVMQTHIAAYSGRITHFAGDAILAEFADAASALQSAIDAQLAMRKWNAWLPPEQHIQFRIGVNFGEVIRDKGDIYGNAVNLAARLEGLARSGEICVSGSVHANSANQIKANFLSLGKCHVKNISEPVQAFSIEFDSPQAVKVNTTYVDNFSWRPQQ